AAGFVLKEEYLDVFEEKIKTAFSKIPKETVSPDLLLESELDTDDINLKTLKTISGFEPFGQGNPKPGFLFKNVEVLGSRTFGNGGIHLEISFKNSKNEIINAVGFFSARALPEIKAGEKMDLAGSVDLSRYRGREELRLKIIEFKIV
ncbi:MAG: hypothetical protein HYW09_00585, partial [Candidatus Niyogibacteria bacterium]|nr:hypothetical protein [Candidatus Niyogibacteria bacterium]